MKSDYKSLCFWNTAIVYCLPGPMYVKRMTLSDWKDKSSKGPTAKGSYILLQHDIKTGFMNMSRYSKGI